MANLPATTGVQLLDSRGQPMMSNKSSYSASAMNKELALWRPMRSSADSELLPEMDMMVARTRDLIRNHGIASGAVQTHLDHAIGTGLRLVSKPDYRVLGIDAETAAEWARDVESKFRQWSEDNINFYSDAGRRLTLAGRLSQGYRSYLVTGEILAVAEWLKRPGSKYRTAIQMVDPDRLSNPGGTMDRQNLRAGVQLDEHGAPISYHIRVAHPTDSLYLGANSYQWKEIPRETNWGRQIVMHTYDQERPGQTRGKTGFASIISKMKMLERFEQATLQSAIVNAMYAAVIESSLDTAGVAAALGSVSDPLNTYLQGKTAFSEAGPVMYDGVKIPHLFPGEKLNLLSPQHPSAAFSAFEEKSLQHMAAGFNLSYEQLSRDYSKSNYSSARAAMLEAWKFFSGRRHYIASQHATMEFVLWLEEAIDLGDVKLPPGAPDFYEAKLAWSRCRWIGPGRDHIDPLKEAKADRETYDLGVTTLEDLCAERGRDWEEVILQRAEEKKFMERHGLTPDEIIKKPTPAQQQQDQQDQQDTADDNNDSGDRTKEADQ